MHDASGCNSTYSTHDEPRWYNSESLVFISGLTEMDAIMGNDDKLTDDMCSAINELKPAFSALISTLIPTMNGCDIDAIAMEVEARSGIPCLPFHTDGLHPYTYGVSEALYSYAKRMVDLNAIKQPGTVNILGATPLDFSISGTVSSIAEVLRANGWKVPGTWAMGSSPKELKDAGKAMVNLVISSSGIKLARFLQDTFGTPYVIGTPIGRAFTDIILADLKKSADDGISRISFSSFVPKAEETRLIIGESVISRSLAASIGLEKGNVCKVISSVDAPFEPVSILTGNDIEGEYEEDIANACVNAETVICDPLYKPLLPPKCHFISLPHEAFSGRMFRASIPDLTKGVKI